MRALASWVDWVSTCGAVSRTVPFWSQHLINTCRMKTAKHVYILDKEKQKYYRMRDSLVYNLVVIVWTCRGLFGFLPSCHICLGPYDCTHLLSLPYDCTPHSWGIRLLTTSKKGLIGPGMVLLGQRSHRMRNLFLSHLFWSWPYCKKMCNISKASTVWHLF